MSERIFQLGEWVTAKRRFERKVEYSQNNASWRAVKEKRWQAVDCEPQRVLLIGKRTLSDGRADFTPDEGWSWTLGKGCHIAALVVASLGRKPFLVPWEALTETENEKEESSDTMCPKNILIGPYSYEVKILADESLAGYIDYYKREIFVGCIECPQNRPVALLHEILHGVMEVTGYVSVGQKEEERQYNERLATALAPILVDTFRRNPELVDCIIKEAEGE